MIDCAQAQAHDEHHGRAFKTREIGKARGGRQRHKPASRTTTTRSTPRDASCTKRTTALRSMVHPARAAAKCAAMADRKACKTHSSMARAGTLACRAT